MAFKRHTESFINYRNNELKFNQKFEDILSIQEEGGEVPLTRKKSTDNDEELVSNAPPSWILRVQPIEQSIQLIKDKCMSIHRESMI